MTRRPMTFLLAAGLLCAAAPSFAVYRCEVDGKTVYRDYACPDGRQIDIQTAPPTEEARLRAQQEKKQLELIEAESARQTKTNSKAQRRLERVRTAEEKRCEKLAVRVEHAAGASRQATGKSIEKARRKEAHIAAQYEAECSSVEARRTDMLRVTR